MPGRTMNGSETLVFVGDALLCGREYEDIKRLRRRFGSVQDDAVAQAMFQRAKRKLQREEQTLTRWIEEPAPECEVAP